MYSKKNKGIGNNILNKIKYKNAYRKSFGDAQCQVLLGKVRSSTVISPIQLRNLNLEPQQVDIKKRKYTIMIQK